MLTLENEIIRDVHAALNALSQKRLAERENEDRVTALIRRFSKAKKQIDKDHAAIIKRYPAPDGWDERDLPVAVLEARQAEYNDLMEQTQELRDIPANLYITEKDLPKLMKGEAGDSNRQAVAWITTNLHFLFKTQFEDEEPVKDGEDGTSPGE